MMKFCPKSCSVILEKRVFAVGVDGADTLGVLAQSSFAMIVSRIDTSSGIEMVENTSANKSP